MAIKKEINNTGELREFLINMMIGVKDGVLSIDKAAQISKIAAQVNENIYAEIKQNRLLLDVNKKINDLGTLNIGETNV